jgi:hypothetical protein
MRSAPELMTNALCLAPVAALNTAGYLLINHHHLRPPIELPLSALDRAIPFWPWTVWPYAVLLLVDVLLPLALRNRAIFFDTLAAYSVAILLNFAIWALFPTSYPRPTSPAGGGFMTTAAYHLLVAIDSPASCFPSGHITIPIVAVWGLGREHPRLKAGLWIGLSLLAVTVLTTKQHYVVDVAGGLATAWIGIAVVRRGAYGWRGQESA